MLVAVGVEPGHGGHRAAHLVVADVERLQVGEVGHLRRDPPADGVVAHVHVVRLLRELHAGHVEDEAVSRQVHVPCPPEHRRRVAGQRVPRQVHQRQVRRRQQVRRDAPGQVVVRQPEVHLVVVVLQLQVGEEARRDGAGEAVAAEVDGGEIGEGGEGGRDEAGEGVEGEIEHGEGGEVGEEGGDGAGDGGPGDGEVGEVGEGREGVGDGAGEAGEVVEEEGAEVGEVGDGVGDGAGEVGVLEDGEGDDAARVLVAVHVVPVAAGGVSRPRRQIVGVPEGVVDGQKRRLVVLMALHLLLLLIVVLGHGGSRQEEDGQQQQQQELHIHGHHHHHIYWSFNFTSLS